MPRKPQPDLVRLLRTALAQEDAEYQRNMAAYAARQRAALLALERNRRVGEALVVALECLNTLAKQDAWVAGVVADINAILKTETPHAE